MRRVFVLAAAAACALVATAAAWSLSAKEPAASKTASQPPNANSKAAADAAGDSIDPMEANSACYVCHMTFVREDIAKTHLKAKVGCIQCHGLSAKHANDENIGATKPDMRFKRHQVDAACSKCHEEHNVAGAKVVARFLERKLPARSAPVCTDCHGSHRIDRAAVN